MILTSAVTILRHMPTRVSYAVWKGKEVTLFRLGSLLHRDFSLFVPIAGYVLDTADQFLDQLGNPVARLLYSVSLQW